MGTLSVDHVRTMVANGATDSEIGDEFGVNRRTVQGFRARHQIAATRPVGKTTRTYPATPSDAPAAPPVAPKVKPITIAEFLMNKRRAVCPVCQLKEPVKAMGDRKMYRVSGLKRLLGEWQLTL